MYFLLYTRLRPGDPVERGRPLGDDGGGGHLGVAVEVPQVEAPGAVHRREQGGVLGGPAEIKTKLRVEVGGLMLALSRR